MKDAKRVRATRILPASVVLLVAFLLPAGSASAHGAPGRPHRARTTTTTTSPATSNTTTTTAAFPAPTPPIGVPDSCDKRPWPSAVQGRPGAYQSLGDGAYLWLDPDGSWALRVTHVKTRDRAIFSGSLSLPRGRFVDVHGLGTQGADIVAEGPGGRSIVFRFVNFGQVDGLDFSTRCATALKVNLHMSAARLPAADIHLGVGEANPPGNPFRVQRAPLGVVVATASRQTSPATTTMAVTQA